MIIRKNYVLYVNSMLGTATFGNNKFGYRIRKASIGEVFDCSFSELKYNLYVLKQRGYAIINQKY